MTFNVQASTIRTEQAALSDLCNMLQTMRPAWCSTETAFNQKWIAPLGAKRDSYGNWILRIGQSDVLWSSHTDTVHDVGGTQRIAYNDGVVKLARKEKIANCLGADCTTGVWIMREMALAKVPGLYIWHAAEECGGKGSGFIAKHTPKVLDGIKFAIAFDRKGCSSVITHQSGGRCASQSFVDSIAPMLPGNYRADDGGTFTDTASYTDIVPECTNLSVGYASQHTRKETQDLRHALALREAMFTFNEANLVVERDPSSHEPKWSDWYGSDWMDTDRLRDSSSSTSYRYRGTMRRYASLGLIDIIEKYPEHVADYLEQMGIDETELWDFIEQSTN